MRYGRLNLTNFRGLKLDPAFTAFSHTDGSSNSGLDSCVDPWPPEIHISWRIGRSHEHSLEQMVPKSAVWHSSFVVRQPHYSDITTIVFSTTGGMGRAATTFYRRLASMLAEKRDISYSTALNWIRCRLSFALLRASIMSIRGARSSRHHPATECPIDLQLAEGHLN